MSLAKDTLENKILLTVARASKRLEQRIEYLKWEYNELMPEIEKKRAGKPAFGLKAGHTFEVVVENANHLPAKTSGTKRRRR